jgi:homoserine trans-succinylase
VIQLTLVGIQDRMLYKTYIDPQNRNYRNWAQIIHQPYYGYVISGIQIKDAEKGLVSADSKVRILFQTEYQNEVYDELILSWQQQDRNQYEKLFD